ncbi:hypothetical protein [Salinisphaera sp. T31B1]|uniref:RIFT barrel domain-containing protein n=1 Tax=Salinisphaera sp. T31B1 TaxID=727963 RepID=UPI003340B29A
MTDPDPGSVPDAGNAVVGFQIVGSDATGRSADAPITFGQVFRKSDVPKGRSILVQIDGRSVPTQVDAKARWPDGSLRHAVITARVPAGKGMTNARLALTDRARAGTPVTAGALLASDFSGRVSIKSRGRTYAIDARDLLANATQAGGCSEWGKQCKHWLAGDQVSEWIVGGPLPGANGPAANISVYFHIRAYADGNGNVERARVDTVIENSGAYVDAPQNVKYQVEMEVGDQTYRLPNLKHYRQARWHRVLWWHDDPGLYARLDTDYLQATGAISRYEDVSPSQSFLDSRPQQFPPMSNGNQTRAMGNTGAQPAIGPLPRWTSTYAVSGDRRAFQWMLANDNAVGSYAFHYRDRETGRPLEITRHAYVTLADYSHASQTREYQKDLLPACRGDCNSPYSFDISHHPSIGYVPYLVTGDYYYLEEMQFTASYVELWGNPEYRDYDKGTLHAAQSQVRGQAWSLRSISDAAFATPDDDPMKSYFTGLVRNIFDDYNDLYVGTDRSPLHVINDYGAVIYPANGNDRVGVAPWQADFFAWSVGHAAEQGQPGARAFMNWLADFPIARMTDWQGDPAQGFCWLEASAYSLQIRDSRGAGDYQSMTDVYRNNFPRLTGLACNTREMVNRLSNIVSNQTYKLGEMVGYAHSATGFVANMQPGLAMAAGSSHPKARAAWQVFEQRSVKPNYRNYPNFAVVPR